MITAIVDFGNGRKPVQLAVVGFGEPRYGAMGLKAFGTVIVARPDKPQRFWILPADALLGFSNKQLRPLVEFAPMKDSDVAKAWAASPFRTSGKTPACHLEKWERYNRKAYFRTGHNPDASARLREEKAMAYATTHAPVM